MLNSEQQEQAIQILLHEVPKYITLKDGAAFNKFINNKITLEQLGICNGVAKLIDVKLQKIHPEICILSHDTFAKFKNDINKYIDRVYTIPRKPVKKKR